MGFMKGIQGTYILFFVTAISAFVSFITGIWIRIIIGPEEYGIWLILSLIFMYGYYMHLGILDSFSRDIPRLLGQKKHNHVRKIRNVVFTWMINSGCLTVAAIGIILLLRLSEFETVLFIIAVLLVPVSNLVLFHNHLFLTVQQFNVVAIIQLIIGSVQYLLMAVFAIVFGIYGLLLGVLTGNIIAIIYSRLSLPYKIKLEWDWKIFKQMLSYGVPITFIGVLLILFTTLDRLIIFHYFGPLPLGHYGIIALVYQGIMVMPNVLYQIMYPKINFKYGEVGKRKLLQPIIVKPTIHLAYLSPFILGTVYYVLPAFIKGFMPDYVDGLEAAKFVLFGMYFLIWAMLYAQYLTVVKKVWTYFKILLFAVIFNGLLTMTIINIEFNIEGVALGTALSYMIYPLILMWVCFKDMEATMVEFIKHVAVVIYPFFAMVGLIMMIHQFQCSLMVNLLIYFSLYTVFIVISSNKIATLVDSRKKVEKFVILQMNKYKQLK